MLADRLTTSEREQLLNEKPMVNFQSQQWDKAPKAHIQAVSYTHLTLPTKLEV